MEMIIAVSVDAAREQYRGGLIPPDSRVVTPETISNFEGVRWTEMRIVSGEGTGGQPLNLTVEQHGHLVRQLTISGVEPEDIRELHAYLPKDARRVYLNDVLLKVAARGKAGRDDVRSVIGLYFPIYDHVVGRWPEFLKRVSRGEVDVEEFTEAALAAAK